MKKIVVRMKEQSADSELLGQIAKEMRSMDSVKSKDAKVGLRKNCISLEYKGTRFFLVQDVSTLNK